MFDEMVSLLKQAKLPKDDILKKRFEAAMVKKMAVLRMPHTYWQADHKINPSTEKMLWATILLEDRENFAVVEGMAHAEISEKTKEKNQEDLLALTEDILNTYTNNLLQIAPDESFRKILMKKVHHTCQKEPS